MRLIPKGIVGRTVLILILGVVAVEIDLLLLLWVLGTENPSGFDWVIVATIVVVGMLVVAYFISKQLIDPLKQLSCAAKNFASDIDSPPIPEHGPTEVQEALHNFNQMQLRIKRFVSERVQLVAAISHDLRTPLTRIQLYIESINDEEKKIKALSEIQMLSSMIQSTLAFLKDESNSEIAKNIDLGTLLQSICDDTSDTLGTANYSGPKNCVIHGKPIVIKRATSNIIENAVRYGNEATVNIELSDTDVVIVVTDKGPGLEKEDLVNVFTPFYRVEKSRNRNTGGVGLGLCIAETLIKKIGGSIRLNNMPEGGLCAEILLHRQP